MKKATKLTKSCLQIGSCPLNDRYAPNDLAISLFRKQRSLIDMHCCFLVVLPIFLSVVLLAE